MHPVCAAAFQKSITKSAGCNGNTDCFNGLQWSSMEQSGTKWKGMERNG